MNPCVNPFFIENNSSFEFRNEALSAKETVSTIYKILNKGIAYNGGLSIEQWESLIEKAKGIKDEIRTTRKDLSFPKKLVYYFRERTILNLCGKIEKISLEALRQKENSKIELAKHFGCPAENLTYYGSKTYLRDISAFAETIINSLQIPSQIKYQSRLKTRSFTKRIDVEKTLTELQVRPPVEKATRAFTLLMSSVRPNNEDEPQEINDNLRLLIRMGATPEKSWISAFKSGNTNLMEALLTSPAVEKTKVNTGLKNKQGDNPLHLAIKQGHNRLAKLLLEQEGLNINETNGAGNTPLHLAIEQENTELVEYLLSQEGVNINAKNSRGSAPLHLARLWDSVRQIELLLGQELLDVNATNSQGNTALHLAILSNLDYRVEIVLKLPGLDVNATNNQGNTALHLAVLYNKADLVKLLLKERGLDVNAKNNSGNTPLHFAVRNDRRETAVAALLMENKSLDVNAKNDAEDTALDVAAARNDGQFLKLLFVREDLEYDLKNQDDLSALYTSVRNGETELIKSLVEKKENLNYLDARGNTPLHMAFDSETLNLLLQSNTIDVNAVNQDGDLFWSKRREGDDARYQRNIIHYMNYTILVNNESVDFNIVDKSNNSLKSILVSSFKICHPSVEQLTAFINKVPIEDNQAIYQDLFVSFMTKNSYDLVNLLMEKGFSPETSFACEGQTFYDRGTKQWVENRACPASYLLDKFNQLSATYLRLKTAEFSRNEEELIAALLTLFNNSSAEWLNEQSAVGVVMRAISLFCEEAKRYNKLYHETTSELTELNPHDNPRAQKLERKKTKIENSRNHLNIRIEHACNMLITYLRVGGELNDDVVDSADNSLDTLQGRLEVIKDDLGDFYERIMRTVTTNTKSARKT